MKNLCFAGFAVALLSGCMAFRVQTAADRRAWAKEAVGNWSNPSRLTADKFMDEYGPPDKVAPGRLTWYSSGAWKRIEVWDAAVYYDSNDGELDLEQTVKHHVPAALRPQLAVFGGLLRISKAGDELSARAGSEELNYLAVNLAHQVVSGSMKPEDARRSYDKIAELSVSGKSSPYTQGLLFAPEP